MNEQEKVQYLEARPVIIGIFAALHVLICGSHVAGAFGIANQVCDEFEKQNGITK